MDSLLRLLGRVPGALMIIPLFIGAVVNTLAPSALEIGSFTTALFKTGAPVLIALFFVAVGSQINLRAAVPAVEKGITLMLAKFGAAVAVGFGVAFFAPDGTLWGLLPLAIIAAMSNSNGALYVALTSQFGNKTDKGAISVLSISDGPFLTLVALGAVGLAQFPAMTLFAAIFPMILGFILGNISTIAREFLAPAEKVIIPFAAFALGAGIDFRTLFTSGAVGVLLGLMTVVISGGVAIGGVYLWHRVRRHPKPTRNVISGVCEATTAGNAIATPVAVAMVDPSFAAVQATATAQIAAAVVTTAFLAPFLVSYVARRQRFAGISPEAEEAYYEAPARRRADESLAGHLPVTEEPVVDPTVADLPAGLARPVLAATP